MRLLWQHIMFTQIRNCSVKFWLLPLLSTSHWVWDVKENKWIFEWLGIEKIIFSLTLDNASTNDVLIKTLKSELVLQNSLVCNGEFLHVHFCAHHIKLVFFTSVEHPNLFTGKCKRWRSSYQRYGKKDDGKVW